MCGNVNRRALFIVKVLEVKEPRDLMELKLSGSRKPTGKQKASGWNEVTTGCCLHHGPWPSPRTDCRVHHLGILLLFFLRRRGNSGASV